LLGRVHARRADPRRIYQNAVRRNDSPEATMNLGRVSSAALMLSGLAGVLTPTKVASALDLSAASGRAVAETRAGLGGTYTALGAWALLSRKPTAHAAVGVTWIGAAAARLASLVLDHPRTDSEFWAYLAAELGFGSAAIASAIRHADGIRTIRDMQ
jgi:Na+/proline symporter